MKRKCLQVYPLREVKFVRTPGGRVGFVRVRDPKAKTLTVRYLDGTAEDEVTISEKLPGLTVLRVTAKELFVDEADAMDRQVKAKRLKTARAGMRRVRGRKSGSGAGPRASSAHAP